MNSTNTEAARVKLDLHTHSQASPDGDLTALQYKTMLETGKLDYVAVTDHNTVDFAVKLQAELGSLGDRIIVGEEIRTTQGEIIGLYLQTTIPQLLSPAETVKAIRAQGGLVCIPHPFETVRRGMSVAALETIADEVDMIELHNGRAVFQNKSQQAYAWAAAHDCAGVASSDSHTARGWGKTYSVLQATPTPDNLIELMRQATYAVGFPGVRAVVAPKINKWKTRYHRYV